MTKKDSLYAWSSQKVKGETGGEAALGRLIYLILHCKPDYIL